jgi:hypothetical protein
MAASLLIAFAAVRHARAQPQSSLAEIRMESVELSDIGTDSLRAAIRISAHATTSATLRGLVFDQVTINGVRVHVPSVSGPIRLRAGEPVANLPDIEAVLPYRELETLDPVRQAILDGRAQVRAEVRAQVELSLFQKLALLASGAWVTLNVDQDVSVSVPGGIFGRTAAFATLTAAGPVWIAGQSAQEWRRNRSALAARVRSSLNGRLVTLDTRYELKSRDGEIAPLEIARLGLLNSRGEVVAPAEVVEPWSFDDAIAEALDRGDVSVDESKLEIVATPLSGTRAFSLRSGELRIVRELRGVENAISTTTKRRYHVRFRDRDTNAVLLEIPVMKSAGQAFEPAAGVGDGEWQPAAVVRLIHRDSRPEPVLWLTEARLTDGRYQIKDPVDAAAWGSPLWIDNGVAGLLQDEGSAAEIRGVSKKLQIGLVQERR